MTSTLEEFEKKRGRRLFDDELREFNRRRILSIRYWKVMDRAGLFDRQMWRFVSDERNLIYPRNETARSICYDIYDGVENDLWGLPILLDIYDADIDQDLYKCLLDRNMNISKISGVDAGLRKDDDKIEDVVWALRQSTYESRRICETLYDNICDVRNRLRQYSEKENCNLSHDISFFWCLLLSVCFIGLFIYVLLT